MKTIITRIAGLLCAALAAPAGAAQGPAAALVPASAPALALAPALADCDAGFQRVLQPVPAAGRAMDARAVWLDARTLRWPGADAAAAGLRVRLLHSAVGQVVAERGRAASGFDAAFVLGARSAPLAAGLAERFRWVAPGGEWVLAEPDAARLKALHRGQLVLVQEDAAGQVLQATAVQAAGALDALYAAAERTPELGATPRGGRTGFALWAPSALQVSLCLHRTPRETASELLPLFRDEADGVWSTLLPRDLSGRYYTYLVDVFVRGVGIVRNRVTDPYAVSLSADSRHAWIGRLDDPRTAPKGWRESRRPDTVRGNTDLVIYELHVRDFSLGDATVPPAHRGTYLGFTHPHSRGMRHLRAMARAGLTDVHLLPVYDIASVPERGCKSPDPAVLRQGAPDGETQQAAVAAIAGEDCFNWGYDPFHYTAPEGSYATDADDGALRVRELRAMVMSLHRAGLRVGMDVVYNHTMASGQHRHSVLDRIVPGYYHRLNAEGQVETSTCCDNTATENTMMARLMIDSAVTWVREHRIDSFRFDLMGHQPRAAMERLQAAVNAAAGRHVHLIGEGWNFGEVADGARFVQASQLSLNGSGIGTFSDRGRDAARGGGCCDGAREAVERQGWLNGLFYLPNGSPGAARATREDLQRTADLMRVGLAGSLRTYRLTTADGSVKPLEAIAYAGSQPAGYASQPGEVVNYVENHDNQTLWDIHALKLPRDVSASERARIQVLGMASTAFSQGVAYFHAGIEILRSKSLDRNSYNSGDWFNRLDWTLTDNGFGAGLPPKADNAEAWPVFRPLLSDARLKPAPADIRFARDAFLDLLRIRASTPLFRLASADEIQRRLTLPNTGPAQVPTALVGHLDGRGLPGARFAEVLYAIHAGPEPLELPLPELRGRSFRLHPVHLAPAAADARPARESRWDAARGVLRLPPRTALVYVIE